MRYLLTSVVALVLLAGAQTVFADFSDDFEDGDMVGWVDYTPGWWSDNWTVEANGRGGNATNYLWQAAGSVGAEPYGYGASDTLGALMLVDSVAGSQDYTDFELDTKMYLDPNYASGFDDAAIVFGYEDTLNYYYVMFNEADANTKLFMVTNKHSSSPDTAYRYEIAASSCTGIPSNVWYDVEITRVGDIVNVTLDGNAILTDVDLAAGYGGWKPENGSENYVLGEGQVGVGSYNDAVAYDDFSVVVPEPTTMTLLGLGAVGVLLRRRRR